LSYNYYTIYLVFTITLPLISRLVFFIVKIDCIKMKAIIISKPGESGVLTLHELPDPIMDNDEVLVEVAAAGINRADLLQRRGLYPSPRGYRDDMPG
jgi:hypothetical protein